MKIYDACIYYDEDLLLDLRFNILNKHVEKFIVVESLFKHSGEKKKQNFNIENFKKFKNKIEYILLKDNPKNIYEIRKDDKKRLSKTIDNANLREIYQRNAIIKGLEQINNNDWLIISDVDEINFDWFSLVNSVGICGATSTPLWMMEKVSDFISKIK